MGDFRRSRVFWAGIVAAHVIVTALTWRDIRHRAASEVRGPKRFWRIASAMQMGNSLAYWLVGRRPVATPD
jgi:hypothetical protein